MSKDKHRIKVPKLERSGVNWVTYRNRFIWALQSKSIDDHIAEFTPTLDYINLGDVNDLKPQARWKKEEHTIKQILSSLLPDTAFLKIKGTDDVKSAWTILKKLYEERSKAHISNLVHQFRNAKCKENENVHTHFEHLADIHEQLASMGKVVNDKDYTDTLLASLPASYNYAVFSISASTHLGSTKLTADIFKQFIIDEYNRCQLAGKDSDSQDKALSAADLSKKSGGKNKDKDKDKDRRKLTECFNCHRLGHCRSKCWAKGRGDEGGGPKKPPGMKDSVAQASDKKEDIEAWAAMMLPGTPTKVAAAAGKAHAQAGPGTTTELFDSGASRHMLPFRDRFINYKEIKLRLIQAADKQIFHAVGLGNLKIEVPKGTSFTPIILKDVFHAPDMGLTIVSINCIIRARYSVKFKGKFCIIQDKAGA